MNIYFKDSIDKGRIAYDRIADLQSKIRRSKDKKISVYVLTEGRIWRTFVFLLGCLPQVADKYEKDLNIYFGKDTSKHADSLEIYSFYKEETKLQRFRSIENKEDIFRLVTEILNEAPVDIDESLHEWLVSRIGEMYNNSIEHSSASKIIGCKYFKSSTGQRSKYCFCCYDNGIGISKSIQNYFSKTNPQMTEIEALNWSLESGHSTANTKFPRGLGMSMLHAFADLNNGTIRICAGNTLYTYKHKEKLYQRLDNFFDGTLFEMDIIADNKRRYILKK